VVSPIQEAVKGLVGEEVFEPVVDAIPGQSGADMEITDDEHVAVRAFDIDDIRAISIRRSALPFLKKMSDRGAH
jgi:hypothetical protein